MPDPKPTRSSCCKRGYWNAIAFGAAILWASYSALWGLYDGSALGPRSADHPYQHMIWETVGIIGYAHAPAYLYVAPFYNWLLSLGLHPIAYRLIYAANILELFQWILFLGLLRLYWWTRGRPVTGWSAIIAILAMTAVIAMSHAMLHIQYG